jgi:hypothetical protein
MLPKYFLSSFNREAWLNIEHVLYPFKTITQFP